MKASDLFTPLVGKSVSLLPTGNNVRKRGVSPYLQVRKATILSFKRTKGTLLIDGEREEREFSFEIDSYMSNGKEKIEISSGFNAGFEIYPTDADIVDRRNALAVKAKFNPQTITTAQWLKIGELLGISRQNSLEQPDTHLSSQNYGDLVFDFPLEINAIRSNGKIEIIDGHARAKAIDNIHGYFTARLDGQLTKLTFSEHENISIKQD